MVEILSDSSVGKDTERLPPRYARAGVGEMWLIDARGENPRLEVRTLSSLSYHTVPRDSSGWVHSPLLGAAVRLTRQPTPHAGWLYELEVRD